MRSLRPTGLRLGKRWIEIHSPTSHTVRTPTEKALYVVAPTVYNSSCTSTSCEPLLRVYRPCIACLFFLCDEARKCEYTSMRPGLCTGVLEPHVSANCFCPLLLLPYHHTDRQALKLSNLWQPLTPAVAQQACADQQLIFVF